MLLKGKELGFKITKYEFSWAVSIMSLGAALICIPTGFCIEKYGRKPSIFIFLIPTILGWIIIAWAQCPAMLIFGRLVQGFAAGAYSLIVPIYIGEISENKVRGFLGSCFQMLVNIGILFSYFVGYSMNFQSYCIICTLIPLCYGVIFLFMPETPVYLIGKKENEKAMQSLIWLRGQEYNCIPEFQDIQSQFEVIKPKTTFEALKERITLRAMLIMTFLMVFIQFSGIHVIIFYSTGIFFKTNTFNKPDLATILIGFIQVFGTVPSLFTIDRVGRRLIMIITSILMACCTIILGLYFTLLDNDDPRIENSQWIPLVTLSAFVIFFALGYGPIPWLMLGELFSPDIKGVASSIVLTIYFLLSFIVTKSFLGMSLHLKPAGIFWFFSVSSIFGAVFVYLLVPETKGKSLTDIQKMLSSVLD